MEVTTKPDHADLLKRVSQLEVDLKKSNRALRENDRRFRLLFKEARDMILIHGYTKEGLPGPFVEANAVACTRLGYTRKEMLRLSVRDIVIEDEIKDIASTSKQLSDQRSLLFEKTFKSKSGELINVEINARLFYMQNKKFTLSISRDITSRKQHEQENEKLIADLQKALAEVKRLSGLLPICSHCKKIRDDQGYWRQLEAYIQEHSEAQFSHGICQECMEKFFPELTEGDE